MISIRNLILLESRSELANVQDGKVLINTINAHSFNVAHDDALFEEALMNGDYLIPDGASIVKACRWLDAKCQPKERIAGWDLFEFEMNRLQQKSAKNNSTAKVMFLGSSEKVLSIIRDKVKVDYPNLEPLTYSPPFKQQFSDEDNEKMIDFINSSKPDLLWIGMTAPKQEVWTFTNWNRLDIDCHVGCIGAVFDFYAGTHKRAPL